MTMELPEITGEISFLGIIGGNFTINWLLHSNSGDLKWNGEEPKQYRVVHKVNISVNQSN